MRTPSDIGRRANGRHAARRERHGFVTATLWVAVAGLILASCGGADDGAAPDDGAATSAGPSPVDSVPAEPDGGSAPPGPSRDAPRVDIPLFPGAELVHEQVLAAAVEEVWVVDAPLDDVIDFYAALPGLADLPGSTMAQDDGGGYLELDLFALVRAGETDRASYEAAVADAEYGPLLRLAVVTSESSMLQWFGGAGAQEVIPPGSTVILFAVLTG